MCKLIQENQTFECSMFMLLLLLREDRRRCAFKNGSTFRRTLVHDKRTRIGRMPLRRAFISHDYLFIAATTFPGRKKKHTHSMEQNMATANNVTNQLIIDIQPMNLVANVMHHTHTFTNSQIIAPHWFLIHLVYTLVCSN